MKRLATLLALAAGLTACGPGINETRVAYAPPRQADCVLTLVQGDPTSRDFTQTWQLLGYIAFVGTDSPDPLSNENRAMARPRACRMGGTAIAAMNSSNSGAFIESSSLVYMVLRARSASTEEPTAF